jgi:hypothetical protein
MGKGLALGTVNLICGVPQRQKKCFGNGVKNLSGSGHIPKLPITRLEMLPGRVDIAGVVY